MCALQSLLALCLISSTMALSLGSDPAVQAVSEGNRLFAVNFSQTVSKEQPGNLICSPLSANIALSMAATGAAGTTEAQFKQVLKLPADKTQTLKGYQTLIESLTDVENVTLKLANKLFIGKNFPIKSEFKQNLVSHYHSDIESVDFTQSAKAAGTINNWCKEKTNNRIDGVVEEDNLSGDTALLLANAVYFKGKWAKQFDSALTSDRAFHIDNTNTKMVPTMYRKGNYKYAELPEYEAKCIELPYANKDISMVIILPDKIDGLHALIDKLDEVSSQCSVRLAQAYEREVKLYLPKFKIETKLDLENVLSDKMGLVQPFTNSADFSGISDVPLKIDKVVQKAFVEVNEEGSEAAAVTGMIIMPLSMPFEIKVYIDRPFYYTIVKLNQKQESGSHSAVPLFSGIVTEPKI